MSVKIGISIAPLNALSSAFVVLRGIEESIPKIAKLGYDGAEISLYNSSQINIPHVKKLLNEYGLSVPTITTGQVFAQLGVYFTSPDRHIRTQAQEAFKGLIEVAAEFGSMINIGRIRGTIDLGQTNEDAEQNFIESANLMCDYAENFSVTLILEPVNRYEINYINNVSEGAALIKKIGRPNMKLMPDLFHMNIEDQSIVGSLVKYIDDIAYIHVADSNRYAPGQGHIPFCDVIDTLKALNFNGWITAETLPYPDPYSAAAQAIAYLRTFYPCQ